MLHTYLAGAEHVLDQEVNDYLKLNCVLTLCSTDITSDCALAVVELLEVDFERIALGTYERLLALPPKNKSPMRLLCLPVRRSSSVGRP
jgi:hypothetical protein